MTAPRPLMIFAAGFGTRMGKLTRDMPKPLIRVGGQPLIDRALSLADAAECAPIVVNTHYLSDHLHTHLAGRNVRISHEKGEILDTGGGLKQALPLLGNGSVSTLNPDVIWSGPNPLAHLWNAWNPDAYDALLLCVPLDRAVGRLGQGDFHLGSAGTVGRGGDLVYGGAQIMKPDLIAREPGRTFSLNPVWDRAIAAGRLQLAEFPGRWCDVGRPEGIDLAEAMIANAV